MCAKKAKTTKKKIVSAAWKLFYEQGYDNTTVDDIVEESGTSKGASSSSPPCPWKTRYAPASLPGARNAPYCAAFRTASS